MVGEKRKRKEPTLRDKLAATIRELFEIPHEHAKMMTVEQVLSLVQFHHIEYHTHDGSDEHWNLEPMLIKAHRARTSNIDVPQIAKTERLRKEHIELQRRLLTPREEREPKRSRWGSRKFQKKGKNRGDRDRR